MELLEPEAGKACVGCITEKPLWRLAIWTSAIPDEGLLSHEEWYLCDRCFPEWELRVKALMAELGPVTVEGGDVE
jgi:hypothetical protein